jgi:hypothetical protein
MKMKFSYAILMIASLTILSCSKNEIPADPDEDQPGTLITKMTQGLIPGDDTVFVFNYDADKRIKSIVNVSDLDTLEASFNTAGLVSAVVARGLHIQGTNSFTYNASNQLIQADFESSGGGYKTRYTFEYTGGIISKKSYYAGGMGGSPLTLNRYTTYEVMNGNITSAKEYSNSNTLLGEEKSTYNNEPNVLQPICLLNWMNFLGADDVAGIEMFFNKNLVAGSTYISGTDESSRTFTYTYNDKKQLTKAVVSSSYYVTTRQFAY